MPSLQLGNSQLDRRGGHSKHFLDLSTRCRGEPKMTSRASNSRWSVRSKISCGSDTPSFESSSIVCPPSIRASLPTFYRVAALINRFPMSLAAPAHSLRALAPARNAFASHVCQRRSISVRPQVRRPSVSKPNRTQHKHASQIRVRLPILSYTICPLTDYLPSTFTHLPPPTPSQIPTPRSA
jgi:hypothetical protein